MKNKYLKFEIISVIIVILIAILLIKIEDYKSSKKNVSNNINIEKFRG